MKQLFFILLPVLLIFGCSNSSPESNSNLEMGKEYSEQSLSIEEDLEMEPPRSAEPPMPPDFELEQGSKIIKNGDLDFEVSDLTKSKIQVDSLISKYDSYYESELFYAKSHKNTYNLQVRIPNSNFDKFIAELESGIGTLNSKNIRANDVTEEYVDLKVRLDNNLAYLNQYKEILKKARTINEILEVQEKIRRIEEEIDSKKGRLKFIDDKVSFSTLNLTLSQLVKYELSNQPTFGRRIANAFNNGIEGFLDFVVGVVHLWPFVVLLMLLLFFRKKLFGIFRRN